jgi:hypothetical protein
MRRLALLGSLLIFTPMLWAQTPSTITGVVADSTGAVLPRASVRLLDQAGNEVAKNLSDSSGRFQGHSAIGPGIKSGLANHDQASLSPPTIQHELLFVLGVAEAVKTDCDTFVDVHAC